MTISSIVSLFTKLIDVTVVWFLLYYILKNLRRNVKMVLLLKGILMIVLITVLSGIDKSKYETGKYSRK